MDPAGLLDRLDRAAARLGRADPRLVDPGRSNLAEAAPRAREPGDVAALAGGLVVSGGTVRPAGRAAFGAAPDLARAVLTAVRFEPGVRAAASLRPLEEVARYLESHLREVAVVDPRRTPPGISTMDWAVAHASAGGVPDAVLVAGEALLVFGATADEVVDEILILSTHASI
ncbi:MAG: phosphomethylpyrimidine kinase [Methanospirillum sp.]|nr:phosphomethylpyrimidine kinase [Methanospirillum sp.]